MYMLDWPIRLWQIEAFETNVKTTRVTITTEGVLGGPFRINYAYGLPKKKDFIVTIGSPPQEHTAWTKPDDIVTIKKNQQIHNNTKLLKYWS